jgi:diacylglycerol kinase
LVQNAGSAGWGPYSAAVGWLFERVRSFRPALRGLWVARTGANLRVQVAGAGAASVLAAAYGLRRTHLALVIVTIAAVLGTELINTAIERACDLIADQHGLGRDPRIRDIKDIAAAAVLVVCAGAAGVGVLVFLA